MTRHWIGRSITIIALAAGTLAVPAASQTPRQLEAALQAAIRTEMIDGDLRAAIAQYEAIAGGSDRALAATALLRMAGAYEKLDETQARTTYARIVNEFADQREQVLKAQAKLEAYTSERAPAPVRARRALSDPTGDVGPRIDEAFSVSADGRTFVYTDWNSGDLAVTDIETGTTRRIYGVDWTSAASSTEFFQTPILSPDDRRVAFVRFPNAPGPGQTRIEVDAIDGGARRVVYASGVPANLTTWDWSPDGRQLLVSGVGGDRAAFLATLDLDDGALTRLVALNWEQPIRAEFSPDGRFIAYDSRRNDDRAIYLISADGATETVMVDSPGDDDSPLWTRDGRILLFRSNRSGRWDLYGLPLTPDGAPAGDEYLIESNIGEASRLRGVSTEGRLYVHEQLQGGDVGVAKATDRATDDFTVTALPKVATLSSDSPLFTPDGRHVMYVAGRWESQPLFRRADLDGSIVTEVTLERRFASLSLQAVSPDGTRVAFRTYDQGNATIMIRSVETGDLLQVFAPLTRGRYATPLGWSRDQKRLFVELFAEGTVADRSVAAIDLETERIVATYSFAGDPVRTIALSPAADEFAWLSRPAGSSTGFELRVRSLDGESARILTTDVTRPLHWSADGRRLLYRKGVDDPRLHAYSLDTDQEEVVVDDMDGWLLAAVSRDGAHCVLERQSQVATSRVWVLEHFLPGADPLNGGR